MQKISKEESVLVRKNLRNVNVVICNKKHNGKAKTYYTEESSYVNRYLDRLRRSRVSEHCE